MTVASAAINQDALKRVLGTPAGRKVIWDLLAVGGLYRQPWADDARLTDFNCGSVNTALAIWAECMTASPDLTAMMIKEQGNYDNADGTVNQSGQPSSSDRSSKPGDDPGLGFDRYRAAEG